MIPSLVRESYSLVGNPSLVGESPVLQVPCLLYTLWLLLPVQPQVLVSSACITEKEKIISLVKIMGI